MEDRHWWFRSRRRVDLGADATGPSCRPSPRILDAGCGTGRNLMEFGAPRPRRGRRPLARRRSSSASARGLDGVRRGGASRQLPFEDGRFDLLLATDVHRAPARRRRRRSPSCAAWPRPARAAHHHGARLPLALEPARRRPGTTTAATRATRLRSACARHGLGAGRRDLLLQRAAAPGRRGAHARSAGARNGNGKSDLHLSPGALDRSLELPVRGEAGLIRRGASLPAGVSLGMVCRPLSTRPLVSVVVPVLNEEEVLPRAARAAPIVARRASTATRSSTSTTARRDASAAIVEAWARAEDNVVLVQLSRNFGMEIAMSAGLDHAAGDYVVLMHADLQDPPELIPDMLAAPRDEQADVVFARRIGRDESRVKRLLATGFYAMMRPARARALPGPGGRLPADVAARDRHAARDARAAALPARDGRLGRLQAGADRVPPRRAAQAGGGASYPALFRLALRGAHVVLRRAAEHSPPTSGALSATAQRRWPASWSSSPRSPGADGVHHASGSSSRCCSSAACS